MKNFLRYHCRKNTHNQLFLKEHVKFQIFPQIALLIAKQHGCTLQKPNQGLVKQEEIKMAKSSSNSGSRGPSSHPGPGGNWPSTTGKPSGDGRGKGPSKGK